jgi:hypothetical protein
MHETWICKECGVSGAMNETRCFHCGRSRPAPPQEPTREELARAHFEKVLPHLGADEYYKDPAKSLTVQAFLAGYDAAATRLADESDESEWKRGKEALPGVHGGLPVEVTIDLEELNALRADLASARTQLAEEKRLHELYEETAEKIGPQFVEERERCNRLREALEMVSAAMAGVSDGPDGETMNTSGVGIIRDTLATLEEK